MNLTLWEAFIDLNVGRVLPEAMSDSRSLFHQYSSISRWRICKIFHQTIIPTRELLLLLAAFLCVTAGTTIDQGIEANFESSDVFLSMERQIAYPWIRTELIMQPKLLTVKQFGDQTGVSETTIYRKALRGDIPSVRIGRGVRIPSWYLDRLAGEPGQIPGFLAGNNGGDL